MIFISHQNRDSAMAKRVSDYITGKGVQCYLDVLDPLSRTATDITKHIILNLNKSSHVIAVFSTNTAHSMWVPFELGYAYNAQKGIGTYNLDNCAIPEYLTAFPVMKDSNGLDLFIKRYNLNSMIAKSRNESLTKLSSAAGITSESFIRELKADLGQR